MKEQFNIDAKYRPLNDIEIKGRKIVPTSARLENGILTMRLMINVVPANLDIMRNAIVMPPEKIKDKPIKDVGKRFTCLEQEANRKIIDTDIINMASGTIEKVFGDTLGIKPGELTEIEKSYASKYQKKYTSDEWLFENSPKLRFKEIPENAVTIETRHKSTAGLINLTLLIEKEKIYDLIITGDFHPSPITILKDIENELRGCAFEIDDIRKKIDPIYHRANVEIPRTTLDDFITPFKKAQKFL